jgi:hypothetical protein
MRGGRFVGVVLVMGWWIVIVGKLGGMVAGVVCSMGATVGGD